MRVQALNQKVIERGTKVHIYTFQLIHLHKNLILRIHLKCNQLITSALQLLLNKI